MKMMLILFLEKIQETNDYIDIYTDGSRIERDSEIFVGFAVWSEIEFFRVSFRLSNAATIFTAECYGIITALDDVLRYVDLDKDNICQKYRIFSDSLSIVGTLLKLKGFNYESPLLVRIREKLFLLYNKNISIKIHWIPSHKGINGNEKVDEMVKTAALEGIYVDYLIPYTDFVSTYKQLTWDNNENLTENKFIIEGKGNFYFENFYSKKNNKPRFFK